MAQIRITSMETFTDEGGGTLVLVHPDETVRPNGYWSVPRWWGNLDRTIYEHCARIDDTANNKTIYVSSATRFPVLLIEEAGGTYTFDSDKTREHVDRIWVTDDASLQTGEDYFCPLRRGDIVKVN